jgi:ribosomal protein S14
LMGDAFVASRGTSGPGLAEAMAEKLNLSSEAATGLAKGIEHLGHYAMSEATDEQSAVELEAEAVDVARRSVRGLYQAKVQRRLDRLDEQTRGQTICPHCGRRDESQGRRTRPWDSLLGEIHLKRRYRHCKHCGSGRAPSSEQLGLGAQEFTPRMEEVCTMVATTVPYQMALILVEKLTGVHVSETAVQHMIERRGKLVLEREQKQADKHTPFQDNGLPVDIQQVPDDAPQTGPEVAYLELDGVLPLTRTEAEDYTEAEKQVQLNAKADKVPGGKGRRYEIAGKEVKNAVLYDGKDCAAETPGRGCLIDKRYVSYLGNWRIFALMVWVMMLRRGFNRAKQLVILSDGADWIRSLAEWLPVDVLLILDLYHVKKRIREVANLCFGASTKEAASWAKTQCHRIEQGAATQVIEALRFLNPRGKEATDKVEDLNGYLSNNRDRMDYPTYRKMGLRVGSGAVESANFHVTGNRLKLQGMRWSEDGARIMALLRADLFNGYWESTTKELIAA